MADLVERLTTPTPAQADKMTKTSPAAQGTVRYSSGCFDKNDVELFVGDRVRYNFAGPHTKEEYWNPEYEIVFDPPCFTLKHIGGGKDGGRHLFILKHGRVNRDLELIGRASPSPEALPGSGVDARHRVADAINRARYHSPEPGLPERGVDEEDPRSQEYAFRLADAAIAALTSAPAPEDRT